MSLYSKQVPELPSNLPSRCHPDIELLVEFRHRRKPVFKIMGVLVRFMLRKRAWLKQGIRRKSWNFF